MRTIIVVLLAAVVCPGMSSAAAVPVKVKDEGKGRFTLLRDGRHRKGG